MNIVKRIKYQAAEWFFTVALWLRHAFNDFFQYVFHAFASFAVADGASLYTVGKALGHTQARTTERYAHLAQDPVRAAAERVAARVAAASKRRLSGAR